MKGLTGHGKRRRRKRPLTDERKRALLKESARRYPDLWPLDVRLGHRDPLTLPAEAVAANIEETLRREGKS